ncbi:hypothetical protein EMCRGX_G006257 [Ephydatia muelleri]|eukprot:Em0024g414a
MSDAQVLSKSALKNKKRREKKHNAPRVTNNDEETLPIASPPIITPPPDPRTVLKKQLEEAKAAKDAKKAQELREQLWLWEDTLTLGQSGPGAPQLDHTLFAPPPPLPLTNPPPARIMEDPLERSLAKLKKKLTQIQELKARRERGETLDVNQLAKIDNGKEVEEEITSLEQLLQSSRQLR